MKVSQKEIYNYLISKGLSRNHALGMLANIKAESNFDSSAIGDEGTSGGLFQHHDSADDKRFLKMKESAGEDWKNNWKGQIDYALTEQDTIKYKNKSFDNPQDASKWFTINWERPVNAKEKAEERLSFFGEEFEVDEKVEFKDLEGKEISIKGVPYLINPGGQIDGKDIIIKKEDYDNHVIGGFGNQSQRDKAYKEYSNEIEREGYSIEDFTEDVNKGSISYDSKSEYNKEFETEDIKVSDPIPEGPLQELQIEQEKEESKETEILKEETETQELLVETQPLSSGTYTDAEGNLYRKGTEGGWQVKYNKATREKGAPIVDQFGTPSFKMEYDYEDDWSSVSKEEYEQPNFENQFTLFKGDLENLPSVTTETEEVPLTNLQKAGKVGDSLLKGAGAALDAIGGPGAIISYIMGKKGLKAAMKEVQPQASAQLSPMFMQHLRQTRELAKKGFHPDQAQKFRKELDKSYQIGLENAVRGSGGSRARFLAQSGVLDAQRSSALLDYAAKDEELQVKNQEKYEKMMLFKENFDIQKTEKERAEDMERQIANKKAAAGFTAAAFTNLLSGFGSSSLVPNPAQGTTNLFNPWDVSEETTTK